MFANELHATLARVAAYGAALAAFALIVWRSSAARRRRQERERRLDRSHQAAARLRADHAGIRGRAALFDLASCERRRAQGRVELRRAGRRDRHDRNLPRRCRGRRHHIERFGAAPVCAAHVAECHRYQIWCRARRAFRPRVARSCLRFSRKYEELRFEISGTFCNAGMELVDRGMVACALDRLSLVSAGSEPRLATLFARAELRRTFCGQRSVFFAATPKLTGLDRRAARSEAAARCQQLGSLFAEWILPAAPPAGARGG